MTIVQPFGTPPVPTRPSTHSSRDAVAALRAPTDDSPPALAELARSLGHPARVALIRRLADSGSLTAGDLVDGSGLAASTVSEHLRILRDAGVVSATHDGPRVWYRLDRRAVRALVGGLCTIVGCPDVAPHASDLADGQRDQGPGPRGTFGPHGNRRTAK